jgi:hypothetical protein
VFGITLDCDLAMGIRNVRTDATKRIKGRRFWFYLEKEIFLEFWQGLRQDPEF